ncbi:hypothetical protein HHK36_008954 [Tetracentron sinense]|uniref:DOG1 domain-containing protein n=1 Tax=Tetracentron sinense TaxID=13715 RepID=A0A834ZK01_TETSI|nr:hypothetical protein HHK36_008954 [Tetracentron sinense]
MSVLPSSASASAKYMGSVIRNGTADGARFQKFFECWLVEQNQHLQELLSASRDRNNNASAARTESTREEEERVLRPLINRVIRHYEDYYRAKSRCAKQDALSMLSPSWITTLEDAFLWIGGWRPTMAFHLLYSKSGLQLEARLSDIIRGLSTGDLADLSPRQLAQVDELQRRTIREEKEITEKMAKHQETVADSSMVELSHIVTELMSQNGGVEEERVESVLAPKEEKMEKILERADDLRLRTLKGILEILYPLQAVHFLIAAAELHLRLHDWGKKRDEQHHHVVSGTNGN